VYNAKIIKVNNLTKHPNADRLQIVMINGQTYIVDMSVQLNDLMVMFEGDGQLSPDFCRRNNLYRDANQNDNVTKTGFFEENRRIRAQPFRGVKSYGVLLGLNCFDYASCDSSEFKEGQEFYELNGNLICDKFYTKATRAARAKHQSHYSTHHWNLTRHFDTEAYGKAFIPEWDNVRAVFTEKLHGTSGRTGNVFVTRVATKWWEKVIKFFGGYQPKYELVTGTRNTICNERADVKDPHSAEHFRWKVHQMFSKLDIKMDEIIYYEIVGYDNLGGLIMGTHSTEKLKTLEGFKQQYGKTIKYTYGQAVGTWGVYVYRITQGGRDLLWGEIQTRCEQLGLNTVPLMNIYTGTTSDIRRIIELDARFDITQTRLGEPRDAHPAEGFVVRFESDTEFLLSVKQKYYPFLVMEGILKENDNYIDTEEVA
jgi:hypothetical protein